MSDSPQPRADDEQPAAGQDLPANADRGPNDATARKATAKRIQRSYIDERKILLAAEQDASKGADHWLLTLSGGALGISMAFLKNIVPVGEAQYVASLVSAWILFGFAILSAVVAMRVSQNGLREFRRILDEELMKGIRGYAGRVRDAQKRRWEPKCVRCLNWMSLAFFFVGILLLCLFVYVNLGMKE